MLSGAREADCFREVAALHSDHLRQVPLYQSLIHVCKRQSRGKTFRPSHSTTGLLVVHSCY